MIGSMKVHGNPGAETPQADEAHAPPSPPSRRQELEAEIDRERHTLLGRKADAGLARHDKWSTGLARARPAPGKAHGLVLSAADCAKFRERFREAGAKLGVVACATLDSARLGKLKEQWTGCGDVLGAVACAKAGLWKHGAGADSGLNVATASLSQICRKIDLSAFELRKGAMLEQLSTGWRAGHAVGVEPADRKLFEKLWAAITPDLNNLSRALAHCDVTGAPPESRWGTQ